MVSGAVRTAEAVAGALLTFVVLFFFLKDGDRIAGYCLARVGPRHREDARAAGERAWGTLAGFIGGQVVIAAADAVGIGLGLVLIGVPLAGPLAILTFFGGFFPIVGATAAGLVAVLVGLVSGGLTDALLVLAVVFGVQQLESNVLEPVVMGRAVPLHPVVILVAIGAGTVLAGVVGAFLAVPLAAVAAAVGNELRVRRERERDEGERDEREAESPPPVPPPVSAAS